MKNSMDMDARLGLPRTPETNPVPDHTIAYGDLIISCYEQGIPTFVGAEIDRLYGHLLCSLSHFEVAKGSQGASTYVVRKGDATTTVFLFKREKNEVTVINEFIEIEEGTVALFARYIFARFPSVRVISFSKVHPTFGRLPYPHQTVTCTEDFVVYLPATVKEYENNVGKNMRRNIKRYNGMLQQDFPTYRYRVTEGHETSEQHIRDIVKLNWARMANKNIVSRIDEDETHWIVQQAKRCGIVGVATIDDRVCGGAIGFRIGENYFMHVIAHDPAYNAYSLGILCYYFTICEGIARGGKRFHLLPGRYEYKYRLQGVLREVARVDIYRNRLHALAYCGRIVHTAWYSQLLQTKLWLLDAERRDDRSSRLAARIVRALRTLKRSRMSTSVKSAR